ALAHDKGLALFGSLLNEDCAQVLAIDADWAAVERAYSAVRPVLLLSDFAKPAATEAEMPAEMEGDDRLGRLEETLRRQIAKVTGLKPEQILKTQPLSAFGFDSLLSLELLLSIEASVGMKLPLGTLSQDTTLAQLAAQLLSLIPAQTGARPAKPAAQHAAAAPAAAPTVGNAAQAPARREVHDPVEYQQYVRPRYTEALDCLKLSVQYTWAQGDRMIYESPKGPVEVLDMLGGYGSTLFGHNHPELVAHARALMEAGTPLHAQHSNRAASGTLARMLSDRIQRLTGADYVAAFGNSGAETIEAAIKHS